MYVQHTQINYRSNLYYFVFCKVTNSSITLLVEPCRSVGIGRVSATYLTLEPSFDLPPLLSRPLADVRIYLCQI